MSRHDELKKDAEISIFNFFKNFFPRDHLNLTHLERLEAESIHIFREVVAEAENPVMLYSVGKDSSVMLHLARRGRFYHCAAGRFRCCNVASGWDFGDLPHSPRQDPVREYGLQLIVAQERRRRRRRGIKHRSTPAARSIAKRN